MSYKLNFLLVLLFLSSSLHAESLIVEKAWTRATSPVASVAAVYLHIHNTGEKNRKLISAYADWAEKTEIHKMESNDGIMKMRAIPEGLSISTQESVHFMPGGFHIMLFGIKKPSIEGETRSISLIFDNDESIDVLVNVARIDAQQYPE